MENDYLKKYQTGGAPVFEFAPVANPYVDMHQAEISKTLADRWTQNRDKYDAMSQAIGSMQVLPEEEWKKTRALTRAEGTLGSVVEGGDWENATMGIRNAINEFAADTDLIQAAESMVLRKEELATQTELGEGNYIDFGTTPVIDQNTGLIQYDQEGNVIEQHKTTGYDTAKQGLYQSGTVKRLDHINRARTLMSSIHMDPIGLQNLRAITGVESLTPQDALSYLMSGDELEGDKVISVAEAVLPGYAASSEGQQRMRELTEKLINPDTEQLYTEVEAGKILLQDLISTAAPQIGKTQNYIRSAESLGGSKKSDTVEVGDALYETSSSLQIKPMQGLDASMYDSNGGFIWKPSDEGGGGSFKNVFEDITNIRYPEWLANPGIFPGQGSDEYYRDLSDPFGETSPLEEGFFDAWKAGSEEQIIRDNKAARTIARRRIKKDLEFKGPDYNILDLPIRMDEKLMYLSEEHPELRLENETDAAFAERLYATISDPEVIKSTVFLYSPQGKRDYAQSVLDRALSMKIVGTDDEGNWVGDTKMPLNLDKFADNATGAGILLNRTDQWKGSFMRSLIAASGGNPDAGRYAKYGDSDGMGTVTVRGLRIDGPMAGATEILYESPDGMTFNLLIGSESDQTTGPLGDVNELTELRNSLNTKKVVKMPAREEIKDPLSGTFRKNIVEGIDGKTFKPKTIESKLFLENDSNGDIVPVLKQRSLGAAAGQETNWTAVSDAFMSNFAVKNLNAWKASGNREALYLNDVSPTKNTAIKAAS